MRDKFSSEHLVWKLLSSYLEPAKSRKPFHRNHSLEEGN